MKKILVFLLAALLFISPVLPIAAADNTYTIKISVDKPNNLLIFTYPDASEDIYTLNGFSEYDYYIVRCRVTSGRVETFSVICPLNLSNVNFDSLSIHDGSVYYNSDRASNNVIDPVDRNTTYDIFYGSYIDSRFYVSNFIIDNVAGQNYQYGVGDLTFTFPIPEVVPEMGFSFDDLYLMLRTFFIFIVLIDLLLFVFWLFWR